MVIDQKISSNAIFDLSRVAGWGQGKFTQLMKRALTGYFMGLSRIKINKGTSELADNWMYYEHALFHKGRIAVVIRGGKLYMIESGEIVEVNGGAIATNSSLFELNGYHQFKTMKAYVPGKDGKMALEYFEEKDFAICLNSLDQLPTLDGIDFYLEKLEQILEAVAYDMEMSRKNLIFLVPEKPADKDWGEMMLSWKQGIFAFVSFEKSARPRTEQNDGEAPSKKGGFSMSEVDFHIYQPQGKEREQLWNDWQKIWDSMLFTYGICFDVLMNKEERASISEVKAAVDYFVCREQERAQLREQFIRKVSAMLQADYKLEYGRLGKL